MRPAFTLIELLVVIAILAILAGLLFSAIKSMQAQALAVKCLGNQRQIGTAHLQYVSDCEGRLPYVSGGSGYTLTYEVNLAPVLGATMGGLGICPVAIRPAPPGFVFTYGHNASMADSALNAISGLGTRMYLVDSRYYPAGNRFFFHISPSSYEMHGKRVNAWFLDGHAESVPGSAIPF